MKKIFSKLDKNEKIENVSNKETTTASFYGKSFLVGRLTVTVETVIEEGKLIFFLIHCR